MILEILMEMARTAEPAAQSMTSARVSGTPFVFLIILLVVLFTIVKWGLIIWGIVWLVRYLKTGREEKQRFRLELGKLAEEVQLLRQGLEGGETPKSSAERE